MKPTRSTMLVLTAALMAMWQATAWAETPDEAIARLAEQVMSTGPNGEEPVAASTLSLTDAERQQIREMGATAALVMQYSGTDWTNAQVGALTATFDEMGIEVVAVTDAGFKADKQVSDIETVMAQSPSIIVSIPVDPVATANAYRTAHEAGTHLVFMDNVPAGFSAGADYTASVSADNYGNGVASAHLMAKALGSSGKVGVIYFAADFFVTNQRREAFVATIAESYPDIEIVEEQGIGGPDFTGDADKAASAMLVANPDLDGIWAVWDLPAEGVMSAARAAGRTDLVVTTIDLGENVAIEMARGGMIKGIGAQRPYDQGVAEAILAGYALLGKPAPAYVALPALAVEQANLLESWQTVYREEAPASIADSMK